MLKIDSPWRDSQAAVNIKDSNWHEKLTRLISITLAQSYFGRIRESSRYFVGTKPRNFSCLPANRATSARKTLKHYTKTAENAVPRLPAANGPAQLLCCAVKVATAKDARGAHAAADCDGLERAGRQVSGRRDYGGRFAGVVRFPGPLPRRAPHVPSDRFVSGRRQRRLGRHAVDAAPFGIPSARRLAHKRPPATDAR